MKEKNIRFKDNDFNEGIIRDENDFQQDSEIVLCPNCSTNLNTYHPIYGYDGFAMYCPNAAECDYATVYDERLRMARQNYLYNENYHKSYYKFKFIGERKITYYGNQATESNTDAKRKEIITKNDSINSSLNNTHSNYNNFLDNNLKCGQCGFNNKPKSNFCGMCQNSLSLNCSKCSNLNPSGSSFCNKCGYTLA